MRHPLLSFGVLVLSSLPIPAAACMGPEGLFSRAYDFNALDWRVTMTMRGASIQTYRIPRRHLRVDVAQRRMAEQALKELSRNQNEIAARF